MVRYVECRSRRYRLSYQDSRWTETIVSDPADIIFYTDKQNWDGHLWPRTLAERIVRMAPVTRGNRLHEGIHQSKQWISTVANDVDARETSG